MYRLSIYTSMLVSIRSTINWLSPWILWWLDWRDGTLLYFEFAISIIWLISWGKSISSIIGLFCSRMYTWNLLQLIITFFLILIWLLACLLLIFTIILYSIYFICHIFGFLFLLTPHHITIIAWTTYYITIYWLFNFNNCLLR